MGYRSPLLSSLSVAFLLRNTVSGGLAGCSVVVRAGFLARLTLSSMVFHTDPARENFRAPSHCVVPLIVAMTALVPTTLTGILEVGAGGFSPEVFVFCVLFAVAAAAFALAFELIADRLI